MNNIIIIGSGISANTAAIYTARADLNPIILYSPFDLDQLSLTTTVENFPGFPNGVIGPELVNNSKKQAEKFGAKYIKGKVIDIKIGKTFEVITKNKSYKSKAVIIATGASARTLNIPGEQKYFGRGVSTCAICDAALYRNKEVIIIGGGDAAMEDAIALYKFAKKIYLIHRRDELRASKIMQDRLFKLKDKIKILWNSVLTEVLGDGKFVTGGKIKNVKTGKIYKIKCDGVFLAIGHTPNTSFIGNKVKMDRAKFIKTNNTKTNISGLFAAGDVQDSRYKQAITAAASGCQAALEAEKYLENLK